DTVVPDVPSASVDFAYSLLVLQHLEREDAFLLMKELRRIVAPTGTVVITFPNLLADVYLQSFVRDATTGGVNNPVRARIYTPQEVGAILPAAGFSVTVEEEVEVRAVCRPLP
ncbi:MAG TPA: methyltransferase domain-containing protein, partial [Acidimicrobiales bacterium]|nr:methyltransferase domain-containing protein [Acidimicrobiales bacterium]